MQNEIIGLCSECDEGRLRLSTYDDEYTFNEQPLLVEGLECGICENCGAEIITPPLVKKNQKRITDAKRAVLGRLTSTEIIKTREILGLTQQQASEIFGGGSNAFSKYERGEVIQSEPMDKLLRIAAQHPECVGIIAPLWKSSGSKVAVRQKFMFHPGLHSVENDESAIHSDYMDWSANYVLAHSRDIFLIKGEEGCYRGHSASARKNIIENKTILDRQWTDLEGTEGVITFAGVLGNRQSSWQ